MKLIYTLLVIKINLLVGGEEMARIMDPFKKRVSVTRERERERERESVSYV